MHRQVSIRGDQSHHRNVIACLEVLEIKAWPPWPPWLFQLPRDANKRQEDAPLFRCRHRLGRPDSQMLRMP